MRLSRTTAVILLVVLFLASFFVRAYHPISRPNQWYERARKWGEAIAQHDWAETYRSRHPGVTTMIVGSAALNVYDAVQGSRAAGLFDWAIPWQATAEGSAIAGGIVGLTLVISVLIILIVLCIKKLSDWPLALTAGALISLSPFYLSISRVFHVDGLLISLMMLSALLMLVYIQEQQKRYLVLSGLVGGLALLTKTPAFFLLLYTGFALGVNMLLALRQDWADHAQGRLKWLAGRVWSLLALPLAIWVVFMALPFAAWPAMWIGPGKLLETLTKGTWDHVINAHPDRFFAGNVYDRTHLPIDYYLITIAIENAFPILPLIAVGLLYYLLPNRSAKRPVTPYSFWMMCAYVFFFTMQMTIAAKQSDRYIAPVQPMVGLLAGVGAVALVDLLQRTLAAPYQRLKQTLPALFLGSTIALQALAVLPYGPNYAMSRNHLLGGVPGTYKIIGLMGQNEGILDVSDYLKRLPDIDKLAIGYAPPLRHTMFQYFSDAHGDAMQNDDAYWIFTEVAFERNLNTERWLEQWNITQDRHQQPVLVVSFDGVDAMWLFANTATPPTTGTIRIQYGLRWLPVVAWIWTAGLIGVAAWAAVVLVRQRATQPDEPAQAQTAPTEEPA